MTRCPFLPSDPIAAVTHPDPLTVYRQLAGTGPLGAFPPFAAVTLSPALAAAALTHPLLGVRPPDAPVPPALQDSAAGTVFAALVRMRDGAAHAPLKAALSAALESIPAESVAATARRLAGQLARDLPLLPAALTRFCYALPVCVIADFIGLPPVCRTALVDEVLALVRCIAPGGTPEQLAAGSRAAEALLARMAHCTPGPLWQALATACEREGITDRAQVPLNLVGLLFQACEGTAGLIGQSMQGEGTPAARLAQVLRDTPPIQNTRRVAQADTVLGGALLSKGDQVLVVLGAPDAAGTLAFGAGAHACPGRHWAMAIAEAAVAHLLACPAQRLHTAACHWRVSANARVPEFIALGDAP
ncbi:cytochrome P450 [Nissabacter archeti]|uniref:Cytochrome P450 n=1 Tax=Nissabacter archeti TaxID=1917880 RepID=A0ABS5JBY8_9GAMM|nr:cytochrome P450 [Nissabacter archeti]MBS0967366.1 cytochrome P450 [Nissabacter archeti]